VIYYTDDLTSVREDMLRGFFVGWPRQPSTRQHLAVLRGSYRSVVAINHADNRAVGFVNMLSDGVLTAFIPWLEVLPEYQEHGIGEELMRRILEGTERFTPWTSSVMKRWSRTTSALAWPAPPAACRAIPARWTVHPRRAAEPRQCRDKATAALETEWASDPSGRCARDCRCRPGNVHKR
jgi:GNAT superfamily N-acetyltransferase